MKTVACTLCYYLLTVGYDIIIGIACPVWVAPYAFPLFLHFVLGFVAVLTAQWDVSQDCMLQAKVMKVSFREVTMLPWNWCFPFGRLRNPENAKLCKVEVWQFVLSMLCASVFFFLRLIVSLLSTVLSGTSIPENI